MVLFSEQLKGEKSQRQTQTVGFVPLHKISEKKSLFSQAQIILF